MEKQRLMNVYVNNLTMMESVNRIHDMIREKQTSYVVEVNVDVVMKMEKDPYLKKISDEADLTLVDGQPLVWISKMKGNTPIREKISGSDLVPELLDELSRENRSVFILGGLGDTAKKAAKKVTSEILGRFQGEKKELVARFVADTIDDFEKMYRGDENGHH